MMEEMVNPAEVRAQERSKEEVGPPPSGTPSRGILRVLETPMTGADTTKKIMAREKKRRRKNGKRTLSSMMELPLQVGQNQ